MAEPDNKSQVLQRIPKDSKIIISEFISKPTSDGYQFWWKAKYMANEGWINNKYIALPKEKTDMRYLLEIRNHYYSVNVPEFTSYEMIGFTSAVSVAFKDLSFGSEQVKPKLIQGTMLKILGFYEECGLGENIVKVEYKGEICYMYDFLIRPYHIVGKIKYFMKHPDIEETFKIALLEDRILVGMPKEMLIGTIDSPSKTFSTSFTIGSDTYEQWYLPKGKTHLNFKNGILTKIQKED
jgi:hypothetical protein